MYKVKVILGTVREGRQGEKVAKLFMDQISKNSNIEAELLDLKDWKLPFFQEPASMRWLNGKYSEPVIGDWVEKIKEGDAYVFITTEYNHGYTAVMKNAIDYAYEEWNRKPAGFVGYSMSPFAGIRAIEQLKGVLNEVQVAPIHNTLFFPNVHEAFDESGELKDKSAFDARYEEFEQDLLWWTKALKDARGN